MNPKNTTLHALEIFLAVAREKNFSEVARQYDVASSVISRQIKQLEDDFGQTLFYRNTRAMSLTQAGEMFAAHAKTILGEFHHLLDEFNDKNQEPNGTIHINAPVVFGQKHIAPYLGELAKRYPKLHIHLSQTDDFIDPYSEMADMIVRVAVPTDSNLKQKIIARQRHFLLASPAYLAEFGTPKTQADLKHHHGLFYRGKLGVLRFKDLKSNQFIEIKEKMMSNNAGSLIEMAICGAGIVMMPDWAVADEMRTGKLVPILTDTPVSSDNQEICVAILTPQSAYRPVNVQAVIDFFVEKWDGGRSWGFQAG
ncbi:LysR family transcriptional regulator [Exercitatus varius]|uniref:LysR family transcriptional regulator n=1 Tax=Exercitatus varius TaxID=67857 RepID=A0AAW6QAK7_9PAST|nr:LysR family transcriptional regulator [Exercitatus varius]MDG2950527.1 LysR family transcriptional regulator [Exercitatus varius]